MISTIEKLQVIALQPKKKIRKLTKYIYKAFAKLGIDSHNAYYIINRCKYPTLNKSLEILIRKDPFILTSTGRTGTKLLSNLLNSKKEYLVVHEPIPREQYFHIKAFNNRIDAFKYIRKYRIPDMAQRIKHTNYDRYGEVNGALRQHIEAIKWYAPFFRTGHIVRNGREFINSVMNRDTFNDIDKISGALMPPLSELSQLKWADMEKFEKICWLWNYENRQLMEHCDFTVKFENLISDYDYFMTNLLRPLNLNISKESWQQSIKYPVNTTKTKLFTDDDWTNEHEEQFNFYCKDLMTTLGYK